MDQDVGYFLAWILNKLFKERPSCAFTSFVSILVLVMGWLLLVAKQPSDRTGPILGLSFIVIVVLVRAARVIWVRNVQDTQETDTTSLESEEVMQPVEEVTLEPIRQAPLNQDSWPQVASRSVNIPTRTFQSSLPLYGALSAAMTVVPSLCVLEIALIAVSNFKADPGGYGLALAECTLLPVAIIIGALGSLIITRISHQRHPEAELRPLALITGAAVRLGLAVAIGFLVLGPPCGYGGACLYWG